MSDEMELERKILIIEADPVERAQLEDSFRARLACEVSAVPKISAALALLENSDFDLIISDLERSGDNGMDFLRELALQNRLIPVVFYAANVEPVYRLLYTDYAYTFIAKPEREKLLALISNALDRTLAPMQNINRGIDNDGAAAKKENCS